MLYTGGMLLQSWSGRSYLLPVFLVLTAILFGVMATSFSLRPKFSSKPRPTTTCDIDARRCPDGTDVYRTGAACTFTPCPTDTTTGTNAESVSAVTTNMALAVTPQTLCVTDADCGLLVCSGCFNQAYLRTAPPDLACRRYEGYHCSCQHNICTAVAGQVTMTVTAAVTPATRFAGQALCLTGMFKAAFQTSGISTSTDDSATFDPTYVWVQRQPDRSSLDCEQGASLDQDVCTLATTLCGTFHAAPPGKLGYGTVPALSLRTRVK